jgi:hypothetical protein
MEKNIGLRGKMAGRLAARDGISGPAISDDWSGRQKSNSRAEIGGTEGSKSPVP